MLNAQTYFLKLFNIIVLKKVLLRLLKNYEES